MAMVKSAAFVSICMLFAACGDSVTGPTTQLPTDPATALKLNVPQAEPAEPTESTPAPEATPTVPTPTVPTLPPHGSGTTTAHGLCKDVQQGVSCLVLAYDSTGTTLKITNSSDHAQMVAAES